MNSGAGRRGYFHTGLLCSGAAAREGGTWSAWHVCWSPRGVVSVVCVLGPSQGYRACAALGVQILCVGPKWALYL